ncbi:MAG: hypothetical protein ABJA76_06590 [Mucilaginibacter sp.]
MVTTLNSQNNKTNKFATGLFCLVMFLVLLNVFTPLRLITDGIRYLNILEYFKGGLGNSSIAAHDVLPHGYPWLLYLFDKLHLPFPMAITALNITCVLLSCHLLTKLLPVDNRLIFYSLVLLSFVNIKHFTLPVSDQLFTLLFMAGIYFWSAVFKGKLYSLIPALLLTAASVYTRTAGIAIVPGIIFHLIYNNRTKLATSKILIGGLVFVLVAAIALFIIKYSFFEAKIGYLTQLNLGTMIREPSSIIGRLELHFKELGEMVLNMPYSKIAGAIKMGGFDTAQYLLLVLGAVALYLGVKAVVKLKLLNHLAFWVFLVYLVMIFLWPFYDTRFLIPVIPVFVYLLYTYLVKFIKSRYLKITALLIYGSLGFLSLVYSDAISLDKRFFLNHYGADPGLTEKYRVHFENLKDKTGKTPVYNINDNNVLFLLEKYDR